jgi:hypothetical protein
MRKGLSVPERLNPVYSLPLAAVIALIDYAVAPNAEFPGLTLFPILFAAWYGGLAWSLPFAAFPFVHVVNLSLKGAGPDELYAAVLAAAVRAVLIVPISIWIAGISSSERALKKENAMLRGLLPICSYCKKIRDGEGDWQVLEKYIEERTDATFTHGICETCLQNEEVSWKRA